MSDTETAYPFRRPILNVLLNRLREPSRFIQVLTGPRQAGKTTMATQAMKYSGLPAHYATADVPGLRDRYWIEEQWDVARRLAGEQGGRRGLLILDEVQKIPDWSEVVKKLWDEEVSKGGGLHVCILGSAQLLTQHGLSESLAGRFETIHVPHWSFTEMSQAFGWNLDQYIFYGGYPGAAHLVNDERRWAQYVLNSLIETTISRDVLLLTRVDKPALLRQLFLLGCEYSGQILSYQKMIGQLQDAGNTTTLAHYLELLAGAGMIAGLQKFSGAKVRQRGSMPKLLVLNTALMTATSGFTLQEAKRKREFWGRIVETAVGAHLWNSSLGTGIRLSYWRHRNQEADFVLWDKRNILGIEVKSGGRVHSRARLDAFCQAHPGSGGLVIGADGLPLASAFRLTSENLLHTK